MSRPIIVRTPGESHQWNGITDSKTLQPPFATKSAQSGHAVRADECPLSGVKRTWRIYEGGPFDAANQIASTYPNRERFLTELTLDPPTASSGEAGVPLLDEDYLILSTIHSAKGQEWNSVFVLNCVDGCIPSDLATKTTPEIEEERRLVAGTELREWFFDSRPSKDCPHWCTAEANVALITFGTLRG